MNYPGPHIATSSTPLWKQNLPWVWFALGWSLLLLGFLAPWVNPQTPQFYTENEGWLSTQLHNLSNMKVTGYLLEGLHCPLPCTLSAQIGASPWKYLAEAFASGHGVSGWALLFGPFSPSMGVRWLAGSFFICFLLSIVWPFTRQTDSKRIVDLLIGASASFSLFLSLFQLPTIDTLGYRDNFLLSLIATLGGSHQGWGLWVGLSGLFILLMLSAYLLVNSSYSRTNMETEEI